MDAVALCYEGEEPVLRTGLGREKRAKVVPPSRLFGFTWRRHNSKLLKHPYIISDCSMLHNFAVGQGIDVNLLDLKLLAGRRDSSCKREVTIQEH
jgi:hypothetical protein